MLVSGRWLTFLAAALCCFTARAQKASGAGHKGVSAAIPFVGCKFAGQMGPGNPPKSAEPHLPVSREAAPPIPQPAARRLAYYWLDQDFGVLAPRGWYCFGTYGSGGEVLFVSPQPINTAKALSVGWAGFGGPAVEIARSYGDTSGRFKVAEVIARVFPAHRAFADKVAREDPEHPLAFVPYAGDRLTYRSREMVEYQTPARSDGLGTVSGLQKNSIPITGAAILVGPSPDVVLLSARLPPDMTSLTTAIIEEVERATLHPQ